MLFPELSKPLFHGSDVAVDHVDLSQSAPRKDFGRGFYTTNDKAQAEKFARLKANRSHSGLAHVSVFSYGETEDLCIKRFESSGKDWLDFVLRNRGYGRYSDSAQDEFYDIVIGPVADDAVGVVLNLFVTGTYGDPDTTEAKETAIRLLLAQKLYNQIYFGTELSLRHLIHVETYDVHLD